MNLLFVTKSFGIGGVEVVTLSLAQEFTRHGHFVSIFAFYKDNDRLDSRLKGIPLYIGNGYSDSNKNVDDLHNLLVEKNIDIIVNQWGLPTLPIKVINRARKELDIKVISFFHNQPDTNGRIKGVELEIANCTNVLKTLVLKVKRYAFKTITSKSMQYVYQHSDLFAVLSPSFIEKFIQFTGIHDAEKLVVQTNPVTIDVSGYKYSFEGKCKEVIFCGRIDYNQKRVYRLIDTWALLEKVFPEWKLTIVGDGIARKDVEEQASRLGLQNVQFEGFQQPLEYYKRASILALTSEYEGFPLVLAECMSFGVVPVVYDSFNAVHDIVHDDMNGMVVPKVDGSFSTETFAERLNAVMADDNKRNNLALAAIETSKEYSLDAIYEQWMKVLK